MMFVGGSSELQPTPSPERVEPAPPSGFEDRRQIWFDGPDGAYLAIAAMRRYLDATVVSDVVLVPTEKGPALELPSSAISMRLVQALIRRFGGHIWRAGPDQSAATSTSGTVADSI